MTDLTKEGKVTSARALLKAGHPDARHMVTAVRSAIRADHDPTLIAEQLRLLDEAIALARADRYPQALRKFEQAESLGF